MPHVRISHQMICAGVKGVTYNNQSLRQGIMGLLATETRQWSDRPILLPRLGKLIHIGKRWRVNTTTITHVVTSRPPASDNKYTKEIIPDSHPHQ